MNILFLTLLDFSSIKESGIYTDLMREFVQQGHCVYIISPSEKRKKEKTYILSGKNVTILKLQIGNVQKTNIFEKGLSTLMLESKFKNGIKKYFSNVHFELVIYSTPPITLHSAVAYIKKRDKAITYLLLKDIFPQNAVDLGILNKTGLKGFVYKYFRAKEKRLYRVSDYIGCMSNANVSFVIKHNPELDRRKVMVCPNTITPDAMALSEEERHTIRNKYGIPLDKKVFVYGGNLGKPQGISFLIECIKSNEKRENVHFLIVGAGTEYGRIKNLFDSTNFQNATLLKYIPKLEYEPLVGSCDVGLIFLDPRFTIPNFPSRLLSYMQWGMPVVAATDQNTDVGSVIESGGFGFSCESGNLDAFDKIIDRLCTSETIYSMGKASRAYLEKNYTSKHAYDIIIKVIKDEESNYVQR